jgi:hypothetical protein
MRLARIELVTLVHIRTVETSMHGSFDKSGETVNSIYRSWGIGVFVLPALVVAFLIGLAITRPNVSNWISDAEQAEFANSSQLLGVNPTQLAQPAMQIGTVKAN